MNNITDEWPFLCVNLFNLQLKNLTFLCQLTLGLMWCLEKRPGCTADLAAQLILITDLSVIGLFPLPHGQMTAQSAFEEIAGIGWRVCYNYG